MAPLPSGAASRDRRRHLRGARLIAAAGAPGWRNLALAALAALCAVPAAARGPAPSGPGSAAAPPTAAAAPATQPIDPRRSSATFLVTLRMRGRAEGALPGVSGDLQGSATSGWRVHVLLDARGLHLRGPRWMDRATRSPAFLAVDRYPTIHFESDAFDDARLHAGGVLHGQLTLRGRRRAVAFELLPSACARPGHDCDIRVQGAVSRRDFGMDAHRTIVLDRVGLRIRVRLRGGSP